MNLFEQQAANRRKSRWLVFGFLLFFAWLGLGGDWLLYEFTRPENTGNPDGYRHLIPWGGIAMSVVAMFIVITTRRSGADRVLSSAGAWELLTPTGEQQLLLTNVVEEMSIASGVPVPRIYIIDDPDPNAFVTGTKALSAEDRFIYDGAAGRLYFDSNGNAAGGARLIATFSNLAAITDTDIFVV